ncbi:16S rRNA (uracil(1498)-N(3))-methyltransferase [Amaricoccus solimangrovi]|uniref:Ribosomal RNA small subunit methyltransferase E n=1 Tax=Amaricoccus solimangrovi TaxID=2589815 RepID=A0A501WL33_9RHOB|nr:16S rRNA (uracil(1498)-N(3))-methyltransferase [Amaricoccus solimangrovi]TPE50463.1 16S rRNA (uracil(1498)-N(3))-methyltransferase [Amaricoccus solimangrovi]
MAEVGGKIRLFVHPALDTGAEVPLAPEQAHYLFNVMRLGPEAPVTVFNGRDGEWYARVTRVARNGGALRVFAKGQPQRRPPDLTLHFAPIKKARTDFIVEKATELGCARIAPVFTRHTNSERLRLDRLRAHAIEAAEQCGETHVPEIVEPAKLDRLLDGWDSARRLMFCDETRMARPAAEALAEAAPGAPWAILIGPEGGFAEEELTRLRGLPFVLPVTLGPRVLRADTAAVAAVTLWQSVLGDWR